MGTVQAVWRFPVKSMAGEQLDGADLTPGGLIGDRAYAIVDRETGNVASAKRPKLWPDLLKCRAMLVDEPRTRDGVLPARLELADGSRAGGDRADPRILKAIARHNRIDVEGLRYPCAGVYAVAEAAGTIRNDDLVTPA